MRYAARYVIETHAHVDTIFKPVKSKNKKWIGMAEPVDNTALCLYDMERYGIDMCILKSCTRAGPTNEFRAKLVEKHPDKFRAFCSDDTRKLKVAMGDAEWDVEASAQEVHDALATGKFIGIGEIIPMDWNPSKIYTFEERLNEIRIFMDLARKFNVAIDYHDYAWGNFMYEWDQWMMLRRLAGEYPDVPIIVTHGAQTIGSYIHGDVELRKVLKVVGSNWQDGKNNIYLEVGIWPIDFFKIALTDPNVGVTQLMWGTDWGARQYMITDPAREKAPHAVLMNKWQTFIPYQVDWWGTALHRIDKIRDWVTQDELNLIMGGTAAKIFKLKVPYDRMFMSGHPDIWGIHWEKSIPYIPKDQIINKA